MIDRHAVLPAETLPFKHGRVEQRAGECKGYFRETLLIVPIMGGVYRCIVVDDEVFDVARRTLLESSHLIDVVVKTSQHGFAWKSFAHDTHPISQVVRDARYSWRKSVMPRTNRALVFFACV